MTTYSLDYSGDDVAYPERPYAITSADDLEQEFEILGYRFGELGAKLLAQLGPEGQEPELLFGLDELGDTAGRAVIRWLPTGEFGWQRSVEPASAAVEFDGRFITAAEDVYAYSPKATQVTPELVKDAVREYIHTGAQPTSLQWRAGDEAIRQSSFDAGLTNDKS
jgi:ribosomal protein S16